MDINRDITVIVVNYRTPDLLKRCCHSIRSSYPHIGIILVDNGGCEESAKYARTATIAYTSILNSCNIGHGPAMHQALRYCRTPFAFMFDTDCEMLNPGLFELMGEEFKDTRTYAVGDLWRVNDRGIHTGHPNDHHYIHPSAMMLDVGKYRLLVPFNHHGAPCFLNMQDAVKKGYLLAGINRQVLAHYYYHNRDGTTRRIGGIPNWDPNNEAFPRQAKSASEMIGRSKVTIL